MTDTEKLTINLGVVELAQIDVLVEQGIYSNRSDLIRTAVRKLLDEQKENVRLHLASAAEDKGWSHVVGILKLSRKRLESCVSCGERLRISVIGMLAVDSDVDAALFQQAVEQVFVKGKLAAPAEVKEIISRMN